MNNARILKMSYIVASVAGVAFFALSVLLLAIWPGQILERQNQKMSPEHPLLLTVSERRGREIYSRDGCAYCHTQQVRYLKSDMARFGAPTLSWETQWDYPHLWGTRRIGPDLARQHGTHSADWQYSHLYSPRSVVADSVMPAYSYLFNGAPDRPKQSARDLVAYLESLGRAREVAGPEAEARARNACNCTDDEMAQMAFHSPLLNASAEKTRRKGNTPALAAVGDLTRGRDLYQHSCATCHGAKGEGGGTNLRPASANLTAHKYSLARLSFVLENGVAGTSMPAWRDFSLADRSSIAQAVRELEVAQPEPNIPAATLELGARVYRANCAQCHGENGAGDGFAVDQLDIVPANLRGVRPSIAESLGALRNGIDGTQMAPWTSRLSEAELSAVAYFVRTFYRGDAP